MRVKPYDPPYRFLVASDSGDPDYLVDLEENKGLGRCHCHQWRIRLEQEVYKVKLDKPSEDDSHTCKHILAAQAYFARQIIHAALKPHLRDEKTRP